MPSITILSNRLPVSVKKVDDKLEFYDSIGGLATGLSSYTSDPRNKWIGWPGIVNEDLAPGDRKLITAELKKKNCYPVFLTKKQLDDFYNGYSNSVLWPLFHNLKPKPEKAAWWEAYESINKIFANALERYATLKSTVWVHDYQLMLAPRMIRSERPTAKIGFFLHIPFPEFSDFSKLKNAEELISGVLGSDLIGFHTKSYTNNFLQCVNESNTGIVSDGVVVMGRRVAKVSPFPMGIDYSRFSQLTTSPKVKKYLNYYRKRYAGKKVIFSNDRLDMTKGLPQKVQAYGDLLERQPKLHKKIVLSMLAAPTRTEIKTYQNLTTKVKNMVDEINQKFGTKRWQPIDFHYRTMDFNEISALYQIADIAFVTPIRDGMNLVAKEYIASKPDRHGVLILSETAGAAEELEQALLVNPKQRASLVNALNKALVMPELELKKRIGSMQKQLSKNTVQKWAGKFVNQLQKAEKLPPTLARTLSGKSLEKLITEYSASKDRLLLFDYDGVLAPLAKKPGDAKPSKKVLSLLEKLAADPKNTVAIVSGRSRSDLDKWFDKLPITLAAEHGSFMRYKGRWSDSIVSRGFWKSRIQKMMEPFTESTPGAFVEEKSNSVVWHYRMASPTIGKANSLLLKQGLRSQLVGSSLGVYSGKMIIEVKPKIVNKGFALKKLTHYSQDFTLIIGDDYTDEDMFKKADRNAYTVKVGEGLTRARFRLPSSNSVIALLEKLNNT